MDFWGSHKARRLQLYHHDNGDLEFIKRDIVGQSTTEWNEKHEAINSWADFFETLYPFDGYQSVSGDSVQLAYGRHYHLELHDILDDEKRPPDDDTFKNPFLTQVAETRCLHLAKAAKPHTIYEKLTLILGGLVALELIIWGIQYATR